MTNLWYNCEESGWRFIYKSTRVLLVGGDYDASFDDPVAGSEHECEGLVTGHSGDEEYPLQVKWDNDGANQYRTSDLNILGHMPIVPTIEDDNPNRTFRAQKHKAQQKEQGDVIQKVKDLVGATGVSIAEAQRAVKRYNGDYKAALRYIEQTQENQEPPQTGLNQQATTENEVDEVIEEAVKRYNGDYVVSTHSRAQRNLAVIHDDPICSDEHSASENKPKIDRILSATGLG